MFDLKAAAPRFSWFWRNLGLRRQSRDVGEENSRNKSFATCWKNLPKLANTEIFKENTRNSCPACVGILGKAGSSFLPFLIGWKFQNLFKNGTEMKFSACGSSQKCWDERRNSWIRNLWPQRSPAGQQILIPRGILIFSKENSFASPEQQLSLQSSKTSWNFIPELLKPEIKKELENWGFMAQLENFGTEIASSQLSFCFSYSYK